MQKKRRNIYFGKGGDKRGKVNSHSHNPRRPFRLGTGATGWNRSADDSGNRPSLAGKKARAVFHHLLSENAGNYLHLEVFPAGVYQTGPSHRRSNMGASALHTFMNNMCHIARACVHFPGNLEPAPPPPAAAAAALRGCAQFNGRCSCVWAVKDKMP